MRVRITWPMATATWVFWLKRISSAVSRKSGSTRRALRLKNGFAGVKVEGDRVAGQIGLGDAAWGGRRPVRAPGAGPEGAESEEEGETAHHSAEANGAGWRQASLAGREKSPPNRRTGLTFGFFGGAAAAHRSRPTMPRKHSVRMSKAVRDMAPLRSEVRALGAALGRVITRIEGRETFDTVEALRRLAKARRAGDAGAERLPGRGGRRSSIPRPRSTRRWPSRSISSSSIWPRRTSGSCSCGAGGPPGALGNGRRAPDPRVDRGRRDGAQGGGASGPRRCRRLVDRLGHRARLHRPPDRDEAPHAPGEAAAPGGDPAGPGAAGVDAGFLGPGRGDGRARDRLALADRPEPHRAARGQGRGAHRPLVFRHDADRDDAAPAARHGARAGPPLSRASGPRGAGSPSAPGSAATATAIPR